MNSELLTEKNVPKISLEKYLEKQTANHDYSEFDPVCRSLCSVH